jgi:hypothetical protein
MKKYTVVNSNTNQILGFELERPEALKCKIRHEKWTSVEVYVSQHPDEEMMETGYANDPSFIDEHDLPF